MEKLKLHKFTHKYQRRYLFIVTILVSLLFVFQLVGNFYGVFIGNNTSETIHQNYQDLERLLFNKTINHQQNSNPYLIIGDFENAQVQIASNQLKNLKINYKVKTVLEDISDDIQGIFLLKNEFNDNEIEHLLIAAQKKIHLYFLTIPKDIQTKPELQKLLGIQEVNDYKKKWGLRFISGFLLSDMIEFNDHYVDFQDVKLSQGTKVFAYSLMLSGKNQQLEPNIRNEELPPLIWRNTIRDESNDFGFVFCVNMDVLMNSIAAPGMITGLLSQSDEDFLYPIINGYHYVVEGMPIIENFNNETLIQLYGKDALRIQQDILAPQISSFVNKFELRPTYAIKQLNNLSSESDELLKYYLQQIHSQAGELVYFDNSLFSRLKDSRSIRYVEWTKDFEFQKSKEINIVLIKNSNEFETKDELLAVAANTAYGFLSLYTDVSQILANGNTFNWAKEGKKLSSLLASHQKTFGYLDRTSLSTSLTRILKYQLIEPRIDYKADQIGINLQYFTDVSYFILKTPKQIKYVDYGSFKEVGFQRYLITVNADTARIVFR